MGSNRICNVTDVNRVQMLVVTSFFNEDLIVQVIQIFGHKHVDVSHDFENIQSLANE